MITIYLISGLFMWCSVVGVFTVSLLLFLKYFSSELGHHSFILLILPIIRFLIRHNCNSILYLLAYLFLQRLLVYYNLLHHWLRLLLLLFTLNYLYLFCFSWLWQLRTLQSGPPGSLLLPTIAWTAVSTMLLMFLTFLMASASRPWPMLPSILPMSLILMPQLLPAAAATLRTFVCSCWYDLWRWLVVCNDGCLYRYERRNDSSIISDWTYMLDIHTNTSASEGLLNHWKWSKLIVDTQNVHHHSLHHLTISLQ